MHCSVFASITLLIAGHAVFAAPLLKIPPSLVAARQIADSVDVIFNNHDQSIPNTEVLQARTPVPGNPGKPVLTIDVAAAQKAGIQIANEEQGRKNFVKWVAGETKTSPSEVERDFENNARLFDFWKKKYFDMGAAKQAASGSKRKDPPSTGDSKNSKKPNVGK